MATQQEAMRSDIEAALRSWSDSMQAMLTSRFGKDKVGHIIVLFPFGARSSPSWISTARRQSVVNLLRLLADHIERTTPNIITSTRDRDM